MPHPLGYRPHPLMSNYRPHLLSQEVPVQELLEAVCVVGIVGVDVKLHGVEVTAKDKQALGQLDGLLLEDH